MRITDIIGTERPCLSFEVSPPSTQNRYDAIKAITEEVAGLKPDFMSVTYGAGGGTNDFTVPIAANLQDNWNIPTVAHMTCVSSTKERVRSQLDAMRNAGVNNVLAMRGDIPRNAPPRDQWAYHYGCELVAEVKEYGGFCIGGACYPETHPESATQKEDIYHLKLKVDAGCEFLTTQMFFDNNVFYNFLYKIREAGITVPVIPGIMPVTNGKQIKKVAELSGAALPQRFKYIVDKFGSTPAAMRQAGIIYACEQMIDLYANGIPAIHVYSMNKLDVAAQIHANLSEIIK